VCATQYQTQVDVNGDDTHPAFEFLKTAFPGDITWNFRKFLVGRDGMSIVYKCVCMRGEEIFMHSYMLMCICSTPRRARGSVQKGH
jgi:glutathione peroxidase-family protein